MRAGSRAGARTATRLARMQPAALPSSACHHPVLIREQMLCTVPSERHS